MKTEKENLQTVGSSVINALRWVLEIEPYNFNK